jgi:hypothetical protein
VLSFLVYLVSFMRSLHPWPAFPPDLDPPAARSLSLLFVLQEFLSSCQLLERLENTAPEELNEVSSYLDQFLLSTLDNPFSQKGGALDKLCFYCEILLQASKITDEMILTVLEEMRNAIMKVRSKLIFWKKQVPSMNEIHLEFTDLYGKLRSNLTSFFSSLSDFLKESRTDENVLLYLIEHRKEFNLCLGAKTIEQLLSDFFPAGCHELRAAICEGYTRRGFSRFYAEQESLLDAFEREFQGCLIHQT